MERGNNYRILQLKEILFNETDGENELGIEEIRERLQQSAGDLAFDHRTIKRDLDILEQFNFEVVQNRGKYGKILYSHQARIFEVYQLRLIVDAILSARFITKNEKELLISKVKQLTSKNIAKTLPEPIVFSQSSNMDYELVKLNIDRVHQGISKRKGLIYQYGRFNVKKDFEYSRDGDLYYVEPYALIWQSDYYYLIGYFPEAEQIRHYRLDRIRNIKISDRSFRKQDFYLQEYVDQSFQMFAGEEIRFKMCFKNKLAHVVIDRFGLDADIKQVDDEYFVLTTKAKLSDGLINWILKWGNEAKVISPPDLVDRVKNKIAEMHAIYK